jgi:hypothetical protein
MATNTTHNTPSVPLKACPYPDAVIATLDGLEGVKAQHVKDYFRGATEKPNPRAFRSVLVRTGLALDAGTETSESYFWYDDRGDLKRYSRVTDHESGRVRRVRRQQHADEYVRDGTLFNIVETIRNRHSRGEPVVLLPTNVPEVAGGVVATVTDYAQTRAVIGVDAADDVHVFDPEMEAMFVLNAEGRYVWAEPAVERDTPLQGNSEDSISAWVEFVAHEIGWKGLRKSSHRSAAESVQSDPVHHLTHPDIPYNL